MQPAMTRFIVEYEQIGSEMKPCVFALSGDAELDRLIIADCASLKDANQLASRLNAPLADFGVLIPDD